MKYREKVTCWCSRENRFEKFGKGIPGALLPCQGESCESWEPGPVKWCVHLVRVKDGRQI